MTGDSELFVRIAREALVLTLLLSATPVIAAMISGLVISVLQAAMSVQEQTLATVAKLISVSAALMITGPWMLRQAVSFTMLLLSLIR